MIDDNWTDIPPDYSSADGRGRNWVFSKGAILWQLSAGAWSLSLWSDDNRTNISLTISEKQAKFILDHIQEARKRSAQEIKDIPTVADPSNPPCDRCGSYKNVERISGDGSNIYLCGECR